MYGLLKLYLEAIANVQPTLENPFPVVVDPILLESHTPIDKKNFMSSNFKFYYRPLSKEVKEQVKMRTVKSDEV